MGQNGILGGTAPTIERGRRCQNCIHWDTGERCIQHYKTLRHRDLQAQAAKVLAGEGISPAMLGQRLGDSDPDSTPQGPVPDKKLTQGEFETQMRKLGLNYDFGDGLIRRGQLGLCLVGGSQGDFVHYAYLCNKWKQKFRPDEAEKADELPGEAKDRMGYD